MTFLRKTSVKYFTIFTVITGLMSVNVSVGKLSDLFPDININTLLVEEIKENFKDSSESNATDGETDGLVELDWHLTHLFYLKHSLLMCSKGLSVITLLDFGNVHLDRFTPPPEV